MRLCGLSNQSKSLAGLLARFPETHELDREEFLLPTNGRLLRYLLTVDGPDLWVGSSLSLLNFNARDTTCDFEFIPPLVFAETAGAYYRIQFPVPRELNMPENSMISYYEQKVEDAARRLLQAIELSDCNPSRITASWYWYVCPKCRYHHPNYHSRCVRCRTVFPSELKCQSIGIYRCPEIPTGAVAPNQPQQPRDGSTGP